MLPLVLAALLGLAALMVVLAPLYATGRAARPEAAPASTMAEREHAAKAALQDVEFDHQLGNLADDDYETLRERYTRRALAALKGRYDRERALDEAIEARVRALREARPSAGSHRSPNGRAPRDASTAECGPAATVRTTTAAPRETKRTRSAQARRASGHSRRGHGRA